MQQQSAKYNLKKSAQQHQRTPQSVEKYQSIAYQIRTGSSPIDVYQQQNSMLRQGSPSSFYKMNGRSSPGVGFKNGLQYKQLVSHQQQKRQNSQDGFSEYSSAANLQNYNSTKDNTKITIINAHNTSVASTIYNINNGFNSNITVNESRIIKQEHAVGGVADPNSSNRMQHKPPLIPSLKAKIQQTALAAGQMQSSKSGNQTNNQLTGLTGLTYDERLLMPVIGEFGGRNGSRGGIGHSNSILNVPMITTPTAIIHEDCIQQQDLQSLLEFKRKEDQMTKEFYCAQIPYLYVDHGQIHDFYNQRGNGRNKRTIFSTLDELDQCLSDRNTPLVKEKQRMKFDDWHMEMSLKCQRSKVK